jgi:poly-D-alanine transfer protein DltD
MVSIKSALMSKKAFGPIIIAVLIIIALLIYVRIIHIDNGNQKEQSSYSGIVIENTDFFLKTDDYFKDTHIRDAEFTSDEFYQEYPMSEENY